MKKEMENLKEEINSELSYMTYHNCIVICPQCGKMLNELADRCPDCGHSIDGKSLANMLDFIKMNLVDAKFIVDFGKHGFEYRSSIITIDIGDGILVSINTKNRKIWCNKYNLSWKLNQEVIDSVNESVKSLFYSEFLEYGQKCIKYN